jgi:hypothetical protein
MIKRQVLSEPFAFWLIREFLSGEEESFDELKPIGGREFYSVLAMLLAAVAVIALTIGPLSIL